MSLIGTLVLAATTVRAVDPPPDGGYANGNTALGQDALFNLSIGGVQNTALGFEALWSETNGDNNTATGYKSLHSNTTGSANTATGVWALTANTTGSANTATGIWALTSNTTGENNTATGLQALYSNTSGTYNTATGSAALFENDTGNNNTAEGFFALISNTTGSNNTAQGYFALSSNMTGNGNISLGASSGTNLTTGDNNIDIGNAGVAGESGIIRIGTAGTQTATFIAGIRETPLAQGVAIAVGITADGQLGVRASSARFKEGIKPMDKTSEAIFSLQPVTFRYKKAFDPQALPQFGLVAEQVAEQVAKVSPDLVARDAEGKPFTVRYDEVNAMLLNEFLKEHHTVQELKEEIADLTATLKAQAVQIQKLSDQLRSQAPAPRVVANENKTRPRGNGLTD